VGVGVALALAHRCRQHRDLNIADVNLDLVQEVTVRSRPGMFALIVDAKRRGDTGGYAHGRVGGGGFVPKDSLSKRSRRAKEVAAIEARDCRLEIRAR